ncbi:phosphoribosylglycinamide formyltransferase [SAR202 cluster bacterium AC-409-J13_OGT_754m]|nr:phosphoribosylglycinamide formyltransferase [SAR202 cluster bacterium AC-409-J13_OGT_754m]
MMNLRLGFLASGGGSNLQAIIDACKNGRLKAECCVVISNNSKSKALKRGKSAGIPTAHLSTKTHSTNEQLDLAITEKLEEHKVNLVILAGYMKLLGPSTVAKFRNRILNIHPALLPRFSGKGFYGKNIHKSVLSSNEKFTGVTIHLVDEQYDHGPIIAQKRIAIMKEDTLESLEQRVLSHEHELYVNTLRQIASGEIDLGSIAL